MLEYELEKILCTFGESKGYEKRLCLMKWKADEPAKLDIRTWKPDGNGGHKPGKGLTLSDHEALLLDGALAEYLQNKRQG